MRIAVLHDHMRFIGGGERVSTILADALDADLYVTDLDSGLQERARLPSPRVVELARVPATPILRQQRQARAFAQAELPDYDVYVLSGNWAVFAAPRHHPNLWYCYTPVRVFYDLRQSFLQNLSRGRRWIAERWIQRTRPRYESAVERVDRVVVLSRNVADRARRYLHRDADVVYPPVDVARYRFDGLGDFWLSVNRLSHEKRLHLQIDAFRRLPEERLVVVGGPQMGVDMDAAIRALRPPDNVEFLSEIEEARLLDLYGKCRGLVATSMDEDFGLTPVEAMASGKAVVAVDEGGYRETVVDGVTGWLVPATASAIAESIRRTSPDELAGMKEACQARAQTFDVAVFVRRMRELVERQVQRA